MGRNGGGRGRGGSLLPRAAGCVSARPAVPSLRPAYAPRGCSARATVALPFGHGGKVMRTRSLVMLAVAVVVLTVGVVTVVTWRTAFAQAPCTVDADCNDANPCTTDVCTSGVCLN